jgi:probable rRNA maturation factor
MTEVAWTARGRRLLSRRRIERIIAAALDHGGRPGIELAVVFTGDRELAALHASTLGDPSPTDVITFDLGEEGHGPAGELYISVERARAVARERGLDPGSELALYIVHGCLHLCGFDDSEAPSRDRMRAAERAVLARLDRATGRNGR